MTTEGQREELDDLASLATSRPRRKPISNTAHGNREEEDILKSLHGALGEQED